MLSAIASRLSGATFRKSKKVSSQPQRAFVAETVKLEPGPASIANLQGIRTQAAEVLSVPGKSVKPVIPDRVPGSKRSSNFQRKYAAAIKAIETGDIRPEVKPVSLTVGCSTRTASSILAKAVDSDDRFSRDSRGRVAFKAVA